MTQEIPNTNDPRVALIAATLRILSTTLGWGTDTAAKRTEMFVLVYDALQTAVNQGDISGAQKLTEQIE